MIARKKKTCKGFERDSHEAYLWSNGYCKICWALKKPQTSNKKKYVLKHIPLKRTPLKRSSKKIKNRTAKNKAEMENENKVAQEYWDDLADEFDNVHCEETGEFVGKKHQLEKACLAHIWSKGSNKKYRDDKRNMIVVTFKLHDILDNRGDAEYKKKFFPRNWDRIQSTMTILNLEYHLNVS